MCGFVFSFGEDDDDDECGCGFCLCVVGCEFVLEELVYVEWVCVCGGFYEVDVI